jgi:DNA-binding response OmpR family regulator
MNFKNQLSGPGMKFAFRRPGKGGHPHYEVDTDRGPRRMCRANVCRGFASHAWHVIRYSDGLLASDHLRGSAHYDAVLVGYRFEGVDGVDLIKQIRALDHRRDVPIVMVTGFVEVSVMAAALTAGADDVLHKPTGRGHVVATVNKCVGRRGRHQDI